MASPTIARLALANFLARRTRFALTIGAVALSVALVVGITSGYASLERAIHAFIEDTAGSTDFELTRSTQGPAIAPATIDAVARDPRVARVSSRIEAYATPIAADGQPILSARLMLYGIAVAAGDHTPRMDEGRFLNPGERDAIVVDVATINALKGKVGDVMTFQGTGKTLHLTIVGVIHKPALAQMFVHSGYVDIDQLGGFIAPDRPGSVTKLRGEFKPDVDAKAFLADWNARLAATPTTAATAPTTAAVASEENPYELTLVRENRKDIDRNLLSLRLASYLGSTVALTAAAFIILATLMTGVQEQRRQLAMLRAVGATRWQIARLVTFEGLAIGLTGAIVGVPLGILSIHLLARIYPHIFDGHVTLDVGGMVYALAVAALASIVAALLPAWFASRAKPLEAMSDASLGTLSGSVRVPVWAIVAGALLACIDSTLIFSPLDRLFGHFGFTWLAAHAKEVKIFGHFILGLPTLLLGAFLIAPLLVWIVDRVGQWLLSIVLRVPRELLAQQLNESPWRSAATGVALMIGLMLLITMNSQGRSALASWKIPDKFPDVFIVPDAAYGQLSIRAGEISKIEQLSEFQPGRVMPIAVTAPTLGQQIFDIAGTKMPDKTLFIGIDPKIAFDMMQLDFLAGDDKENARREAVARRMMQDGRQLTLHDGSVLQATVEHETADTLDLWMLDDSRRTIAKADVARNESGHYLIVTSEFRKLRGDDVGDPFELESGLFVTTKTKFIIVGVVWSPGLDVMLNTFDLPARVKSQTAATVFGTLQDGRDVFGIRDALVMAADLKLGVAREQVLASVRRSLGREGLSVFDARQLKEQIAQTFGSLLNFASTVAWLAMFVATLGVGNAVVAGIRTRMWRLGVLRAIGMTRSTLLRLLLAEAVLLSVVGIGLGIVFGIVLSNNAKHLYMAAVGFDPPLVLPWDLIWIASGVVLLLGLGATIIPAVNAARRQPLSLLQAGRAAG